MTPEEKKVQMDERNAAICAYYQAGHKLSETASHFKLGRGRVLQILKEANVWKPYVKGKRTEFLGLTVSKDTKAALKEAAAEEGMSVSRFAAEALDGVVGK